MTNFLYSVHFHVKDNEATYAHNDSMLISASCLDNVRAEFFKRIQNEFDYPAECVDKIVVYSEDNKYLMTINL